MGIVRKDLVKLLRPDPTRAQLRIDRARAAVLTLICSEPLFSFHRTHRLTTFSLSPPNPIDMAFFICTITYVIYGTLRGAARQAEEGHMETANPIRLLVRIDTLKRLCRHRPHHSFILLFGISVLAVLASLRAFSRSPAPAAASGPPQPVPGGTLVVCGGGALPEEIRTRFWELAGGPQARIVFI